MMRLTCPECGLELLNISGNLYRCANGHEYIAEYEPIYQEEGKFCIPVIGCFSEEPISCNIFGFDVGVMPEYMCSGIKLVLLTVGVVVGIKLVKSLIGGEKKRPEAVVTVYD